MTAEASDAPSVDEAWSRVMDDVQVITKGDRNKDQGFNFRGIDSVLDAVGPILRKHRVKVIPSTMAKDSERYETRKGAQMINRTVEMAYTVRGPQGDSFVGSAFGEAADSGDKSLSKAQSVAYRTFLIQSLSIPTGQPDPDSESHERGRAERLPDDNSEGREDLRKFCRDNGMNANDVALAFAKNNEGRSVKYATTDEIRAFISLLTAGAVKVDG